MNSKKPQTLTRLLIDMLLIALFSSILGVALILLIYPTSIVTRMTEMFGYWSVNTFFNSLPIFISFILSEKFINRKGVEYIALALITGFIAGYMALIEVMVYMSITGMW